MPLGVLIGVPIGWEAFDGLRHQSPQATVPPEDEVVVVPSRHKFAKVLDVVTIVASK